MRSVLYRRADRGAHVSQFGARVYRDIRTAEKRKNECVHHQKWAVDPASYTVAARRPRATGL